MYNLVLAMEEIADETQPKLSKVKEYAELMKLAKIFRDRSEKEVLSLVSDVKPTSLLVRNSLEIFIYELFVLIQSFRRICCC